MCRAQQTIFVDKTAQEITKWTIIQMELKTRHAAYPDQCSTQPTWIYRLLYLILSVLSQFQISTLSCPFQIHSICWQSKPWTGKWLKFRAHWWWPCWLWWTFCLESKPHIGTASSGWTRNLLPHTVGNQPHTKCHLSCQSSSEEWWTSSCWRRLWGLSLLQGVLQEKRMVFKLSISQNGVCFRVDSSAWKKWINKESKS